MSMDARKVRRLRRIIAQPFYYRERAIEMGERFGVWSAEYDLRGESHGSERMMNMYCRRMEYYAKKDRERR